MPKNKKRTYEQLERALNRAEAVSKRTKRAYDSYLLDEGARGKGWRDTIDQLKERHRRESASRMDTVADRVAEVEEKNDDLKAENIDLKVLLEGETLRADNLLSQRAEAAETNLAVYQEAFSASNMVSLGLLDLAKLAAAPVQLMKPPGISLGSKPSAKDVLGILADDA